MDLVGMSKEDFAEGFSKIIKDNYTKEEMKDMYERLAKENKGKREEFKARLTKRIEDEKSLN